MHIAGLIGAVLVVMSAGATVAALGTPLVAVFQLIKEYIAGIYGRPSRQNNPK